MSSLTRHKTHLGQPVAETHSMCDGLASLDVRHTLGIWLITAGVQHRLTRTGTVTVAALLPGPLTARVTQAGWVIRMAPV